jgi:hypothetical protein
MPISDIGDVRQGSEPAPQHPRISVTARRNVSRQPV